MGAFMELWDYQINLLDDIRFEIGRGKKSILAVAPTGSGKTIVMAALVKYALLKGNRIFICVHRKELVEQISDALNKFNLIHGIISPDHPVDNSFSVYVCSVRTLVNRLNKYLPPSIILTDECHHLAGDNTWAKILKFYFEYLKVHVGFTATPIRLDGQGLGVEVGGFFDSLVQAPSTAWLTEHGFLSPARYFVPPQVVDLVGVRTQAGDYNAKDLEERLNKSFITGDAIAHYKSICPSASAIAFCASIKHAQAVAAEFSAAGTSSEVIHGELDKVTRNNLITGLGNGTIKLLSSVDVINEGTNVPKVETAILLRPTQSLGLHLQQVGRVLRTYEDKQTAFILDHVGNVLRHGFADTEHTWTLAGTKRSKKNQEPTIPMKQCPNCYCCHKPASECPSCGHKYKVTIKNIKKEQGELKELTKEQQKILQKQFSEERKKAKTFEELKALEKRRGFKSGWADHVWAGKEKARAKYNYATR